jgi:hypothetical protein
VGRLEDVLFTEAVGQANGEELSGLVPVPSPVVNENLGHELVLSP